jgi:transcriptional regulator with XRE-family HTH domain
MAGDMMSFAGWLESSMLRRGLSQAALARSVGVADAQVSRWRRGQVVPSVRYLQRLADTFGVQRATLDRLVGYPVAEDAAEDAELQAHQARLREIMQARLPRSMWPAYVEACAAVADALQASLQPPPAEHPDRPLGFPS